MLICTLPVAALVILLFMRPGPMSRPEAILLVVYCCGLWAIDIALWLILARRKVARPLYLVLVLFAPIINALLALGWCRRKASGRYDSPDKE